MHHSKLHNFNRQAPRKSERDGSGVQDSSHALVGHQVVGRAVSIYGPTLQKAHATKDTAYQEVP